jgi:hypothetical protein
MPGDSRYQDEKRVPETSPSPLIAVDSLRGMSR